MKRLWIICTSLILLGNSAHAQSLTPVSLRCDVALFDGIPKYNEEISGVKCLKKADGRNICHIVADEKKGLQQISVSQTGRQLFTCKSGRVIAKKRGLSCLKGKKPERDFEAVASDGRHLFITGSWGNRRKKHADKSPERWVLLRQKISGGDALAGRCEALKRKNLKSFVKNAVPDLRPFIDVPLQCGGINIEGLAVQSGQLFIGFRSPGNISDGEALVVETSAAGLFTGQLSARLHKLQFRINGRPQKGIGIRALESIGKGRILIATGTGGAGMTNLSKTGKARIDQTCLPDRPLHYNNQALPLSGALWVWRPANDTVKFLGKIKGKYQNHKLEGLSVLERERGKLQLILAFDGVDNDKLSPLATVSVDLP